MPNINQKYIFLALLILAPIETWAGLFGPSNYDECILESMKGVTSDAAAGVIVRSCRSKFPDKPKEQPRSRALKPSEVSNIDGRARKYTSKNTFLYKVFGGDIYNGNSNVTISQLSIGVTTKIDKKEVSRIYVSNVNIPPQSIGSFGVEIIPGDEGAEYSWWIESGRGH